MIRGTEYDSDKALGIFGFMVCVVPVMVVVCCIVTSILLFRLHLRVVDLETEVAGLKAAAVVCAPAEVETGK